METKTVETKTAEMRIGHGFDVHQFVVGRPLILAGIKIDHFKGLLGHSDADVLLHAVIDSILGALCWGDIGSWFPDTDEAYRNAKSTELFAWVWEKAIEARWELVNCDITLVTEKPRMFPHIEKMRMSLGTLFSCEPDQVSIKATTMEKMGFVGREEGMSATAVILLKREPEVV